MEPQIISSYQPGEHNADLTKTVSRLSKNGGYKDLSCVMIVPCFGSIPTKAVASWMNLYAPPMPSSFGCLRLAWKLGKHSVPL